MGYRLVKIAQADLRKNMAGTTKYDINSRKIRINGLMLATNIISLGRKYVDDKLTILLEALMYNGTLDKNKLDELNIINKFKEIENHGEYTLIDEDDNSISAISSEYSQLLILDESLQYNNTIGRVSLVADYILSNRNYKYKIPIITDRTMIHTVKYHYELKYYIGTNRNSYSVTKDIPRSVLAQFDRVRVLGNQVVEIPDVSYTMMTKVIAILAYIDKIDSTLTNKQLATVINYLSCTTLMLRLTSKDISLLKAYAKQLRNLYTMSMVDNIR